MTAIYSFVIDQDPRFEKQVGVLVTSLLQVGVDVRQIVAHVTPTASSAARSVASSLGVEMIPTVPYLDGKYCNKLLQLDSLLSRSADFYVLCDTDLAFLASVEPLFDGSRVRAKPVDLPNPPLQQLAFLKFLLGLNKTPRLVKTSCDEAKTWSVNCNGGLYIVPEHLAPLLSVRWKHFAEKLYYYRWALARWHVHIDQVAFAFAMLDMNQDVRELPIEFNFPIHLTDHLDQLEFVTPSVLHYHWMQNGDGDINYVGHSAIDSAIAEINALRDSRTRTTPTWSKPEACNLPITEHDPEAVLHSIWRA